MGEELETIEDVTIIVDKKNKDEKEEINNELLELLNNSKNLKKLNKIVNEKKRINSTSTLMTLSFAIGKELGFCDNFIRNTKDKFFKKKKFFNKIIEDQLYFYGELKNVLSVKYEEILFLTVLFSFNSVVEDSKYENYHATIKHYVENNYNSRVLSVFKTLHAMAQESSITTGFDSIFTIDHVTLMSGFLTKYFETEVYYRPFVVNGVNRIMDSVAHSAYLHDRCVLTIGSLFSSMYVDFSKDFTFEMIMNNLTVLTDKNVVLFTNAKDLATSPNVRHLVNNNKLCVAVTTNEIVNKTTPEEKMFLINGLKVCIVRLPSSPKLVKNPYNIFPYIAMNTIGDAGCKFSRKTFYGRDLMFSYLELLKNRVAANLSQWYYEKLGNFKETIIPFHIDKTIDTDCLLYEKKKPSNISQSHWNKLKPLIFDENLECYIGGLFNVIYSLFDVKTLIGGIFTYDIFYHYEKHLDGNGEIEINGEFVIDTIEKMLEHLCKKFLLSSDIEFVKAMSTNPFYACYHRNLMKTTLGLKYNTGFEKKTGLDYDFKLINFDLDYKFFLGNLKKGHTPKVLCYGPSGSGKSEFAKQIASELGKEVTFLRINDFRKTYVGEGEEQVKYMFEQAEKNGNVVIVDECDSLFSEREGTRVEYARDMVNHMLTILDEHKGIVFFTSNFLDALDKAFLRRLTLKIKFNYLTEESKLKLLKEIAGKLECKISKTELEKCKTRLKKLKLTSGMFKSTLEKFTFYKHPSLEGILNTLEEDMKMISNERSVGFL